jgi:hypothetical protein
MAIESTTRTEQKPRTETKPLAAKLQLLHDPAKTYPRFNELADEKNFKNSRTGVLAEASGSNSSQ